MKCKNCGAEINTDSKNCEYCGSLISDNTNDKDFTSKYIGNTKFNVFLFIVLFVINPVFGLLYIILYSSKNKNK